jgi:hypothetical protein
MAINTGDFPKSQTGGRINGTLLLPGGIPEVLCIS